MPGVLADPSLRRVLDRPVSVLHGLPLIPTRSVGLNSSTGREASRVSDPAPQSQCLRRSRRSRLASPGKRPGERGVAQFAGRGFIRAPREARVGHFPQVLVPSTCPTYPTHLPQRFAAECWVTEYLATSTLATEYFATSTLRRWAAHDELRGLARCEMEIEGPPEPNDVLQGPAGQAAGPGRVDREKGLGPVAARAKCKSGPK